MFPTQQPVDRLAHVVFFGFAHNACDGFAIFIEYKSAGYDVSKTKAPKCIRVRIYPAIEGDIQSSQAFQESSRDPSVRRWR